MPATPHPSRPGQPLGVWIALGVVYVVWGSTYLGIRVVVQELPPLISMGLRFLVAGGLLALLVGWRSGWGGFRVSRRQVLNSALLGFLFVVCGNGGVAIAEQTVTSGLAALLVAAMPLWVVLLRVVVGAERPQVLTWVGTCTGFTGIAVLARPGAVGDVETWGVLLILAGTMCWAVGAFLSSRLLLPANPFVTTVIEMGTGGGVMLVLGSLAGEWQRLDLDAVSSNAWIALAYLTVIGSIAGYGAFVWLLAHAPVSLVTTYAYVNPVVAVLLGWAILSEPITAAVLVGGALAVFGVSLVVRGERTPTPVPENV